MTADTDTISSAAKIARTKNGFTTHCTDPILIGQIQVIHIKNLDKARNDLLANKQEILNLANSLHPRMVARGEELLISQLKLILWNHSIKKC